MSKKYQIVSQFNSHKFWVDGDAENISLSMVDGVDMNMELTEDQAWDLYNQLRDSLIGMDDVQY